MIINTDRLLLREFVEDDWPAVLAYQSDPRYLRYYPWTRRTATDIREFVQGFIEQQRQEPRYKYQLVIALRADGRLIGNCGIRQDTPESWEADLGYELAPAHWGRGYATEAARALLRFGFEELRLHRVRAYCLAENVASARVLQKIGMRCEGRLSQNEWFKSRWWNTLLFSILEREWKDGT
jgi:ribosomal-protein-alanine N-acetyltransferase